ncbi:unnamed protein product [Adineta steineri]|uniref:Protein SERAC1 n=1 Tax=Adineta steineri TaxID=433720 RepID=A0A814KWW2_9BILA|nr:unnamed protein product [Adineta steineri]CAF1087655.1 unnamed protein product [Adineta steineri]
MRRRHRTFLVLITSAAAVTYGLNRLIHRQQDNSFNEKNSNDLSLQLLESKLHLTDDLLKNKDDNNYIPMESIDPIAARHYHQALQYIKQIHSTNTHIRERGLSHLAKLKNLPPTYYSIIGQQLDYHSAIQLARTQEANSNLFPTGPPYILSIGKKKVLATDNVESVNDDDVLLHTITEFLDKLIDNEKRPLDILSDHYLKLLKSYLDEIDSQTVFDLVQHFEPEHADMSPKAIKRYRSNLELYSTFVYALRGYADRYPLDVVHSNGLQILKYLYERRKDNVPFVRFIGKILLLLSRERQTHEAFYAVGWVKILHDMALDENNIIYSLLGATILANLDRPNHEKFASLSQEKISINKNPKPLYLPSEISNIELIKAEIKTEEKKEDVLEHQPPSKQPTVMDKIVRSVWYTRQVSDEGDTSDEIHDNAITDDHHVEKNIVVAPDIDTSHSINDDNKVTVIEQEKSMSVPSWINDQVYGDKIILFSPAMYNVQQIDPDVRWHQEPIVDIIFFHGLAGSAFKTWRQESAHTEIKQADASPLPSEGKILPVVDESPEEESDEVMDVSEETNWNPSKTNTSTPVPNIDEHESTSCWPKDWLSKDVPTSHIRMLAVDYESRVSEWQVRSMPRNVIRRPMHDRAQEIAEQLKQAGVGKRPIIWVAHSMGGLLTKYILTNEENEELRSNTRACVFFSVPHFGAELASFGIRHAFFVRPTVEIEELQPNSTNLLNLHERFLDILKTHDNIKILSFAENEKTTFSLRYQTVVVPSESSQINIGKFFVLNKNHIYICKPNSKSTIEYQELLDLIQTIYSERKNEVKSEQIKTTEDFLSNLYTFSSPMEDDTQ